MRCGHCIQIVLCLPAIALLALAPPARGQMLVVPADGDAGRVLGWAVAGGALGVGPGPLPGSLVVSGVRDSLAPLAWRHRALLIAARLPGCGPATEPRP